jgi:hypothetical protein
VKNLTATICLTLAVIILTACAQGQTDARRLHRGQWSTPQDVGGGNYMLQGWDTSDALKGANAHCAQQTKTFKLNNLTPHTQRNRATVLFSCN